MESALVSVNSPTILISSSSNSLKSPPLSFPAHLQRRFSTTPHSQLSRGISFRSDSLVSGLSSVDLSWSRLQFATRYAPFASGGEAKVRAGADGAADAAESLSSDVIVLEVGGMMCEGCVSSVKRILESQVSSASVNLASNSAIIWPVSEAKVATNWRKDLGDALAKHLTSCGFQSNLKDEGAVDGDIQ